MALVTGSILAGGFETVLHAGIDHGKCRGWYGFNVDQALHVLCKIWYVVMMAGGISGAWANMTP